MRTKQKVLQHAKIVLQHAKSVLQHAKNGSVELDLFIVYTAVYY